jgi:hypothetical protein
MSRFLIYALCDPRDNQIRYVGKSSSGLSRPKKHWTHTQTRNSFDPCHNWVRSVMSHGSLPQIEILEEFSNAGELDEAERFWIGYLRFIGCRLTNMSDGGEGQTGFHHSEKTKEQMRNSHTGKPSGMKGKIPWNKGLRYKSPAISVAKRARDAARKQGRMI